MKFTVIDKVVPQTTKTFDGCSIKLAGSQRDSFTIYISEPIMKRSKFVIGDRCSICLAEDERRNKWVILDADPNGYKMTASQGNIQKQRLLGQYARAITKTAVIADWMVAEFENPHHFNDNDVVTQTGQICFPIARKRGLFG